MIPKGMIFTIALLLSALWLAGCGNQVIRSAEIYIQQNDARKAREVLNDGLPNLPPGKNRAQAYYFLAKLSSEQLTDVVKKYRKADETAQAELWEEQADLVKRLNLEMDSSLANGDFHKGKLDTIRANHWIEYYNYGVQPFNDKKWVQAVRTFKLAWMIDSKQADPARLIGEAMIQQNRGEEALEWLQRAIASERPAKPDFVSRITIGNYFYSKERWQDAIRYFDQVLALPTPAIERGDSARFKSFQTVQIQAVTNKAICLDQLNRAEEASKAYEAALRIQPDNVILWFNYGKRHFEASRYAAADTALCNVLRLDPNDYDAMYLLGLTKFQREQYEEAERLLRTYLDQHPENKSAWVNLAGAIGNQLVQLGDKGHDTKRKELQKRLLDVREEMKKRGVE